MKNNAKKATALLGASAAILATGTIVHADEVTNTEAPTTVNAESNKTEITIEQINNAKSDVKTAEENVSTVSSELDSAKTEENTANQTLKSAETELKAANDENKELATSYEKAKSSQENAIKEANSANTEYETAKDEKAVAEKTAQLEEAVKNTKVQVITRNIEKLADDQEVDKSTGKPTVKAQQTDVIKYATEEEAKTNPEKANYLRDIQMEPGRMDATVKLTEAQKKEFDDKGYFTYTPNTDRIKSLVLDYINQIRKQNGNTIELTADEDTSLDAQERADENAANREPGQELNITHDTKLNLRKGSYEDVGAFNLINSSYDGKFINTGSVYSEYNATSDEEVAWSIVQAFMADWGTDNLEMGHAKSFLTDTTKLGVGLNFDYHDIKDSDRKYANVHVVIRLSDGGEYAADTKTNELGYSRLEMKDTGRKVTMLPQLYMSYNYDEFYKDPATQIALDAYKSEAAKKISKAEAELSTKKAKKDAADEKVKSGELKLAALQASYNLSNTRLQTAKDNLETAKKTKEQASQKVVDLVAKLASATEDLTNKENILEKLVAEKAAQDLEFKHSEILSRGNIAVPVLKDGKVVDYTEAKVPEVAPTEDELPELDLEQVIKALEVELENKRKEIEARGNKAIPVIENNRVVDYTEAKVPEVAPIEDELPTLDPNEVLRDEEERNRKDSESVVADKSSHHTEHRALTRGKRTLPETGSNGSALSIVGLLLATVYTLISFVNVGKKNNQ